MWGRRNGDSLDAVNKNIKWLASSGIALLVFSWAILSGVMNIKNNAAEVPEMKKELADHHEQIVLLKATSVETRDDIKEVKEYLRVLIRRPH